MSIERGSLEQLASAALCLGLALLPLVAGLPPWISLTIAAAAAVRLGLAVRGGDAPPRTLRLTVAAVAIGTLFLEFRTFNGLAAGTALLALLSGLKLLETRTRRDLRVLLLIVYFLSLAALLQGDSVWLLAYLLGLSWLASATLLRLAVTQDGPDRRASLCYCGRILLHALPLALVLWLFFPRLAEPLWRIDAAGRGAATGLGESMSPGDIDDLALSDEIAFRAHFIGPAPPRDQRYWRGPVLDDFDGRTWRRHAGASAAAPFRPSGTAYRYTLHLEASRYAWVLTLDWPVAWNLPQAALTDDDVLLESLPLSSPFDLTATSYSKITPLAPLGADQRRADTRLPAGQNVRTAAFAVQLRRRHPQALAYAAAVLNMFHTQPFFYTLTPPPLGADPVDRFLFATRSGFCGHYASAFAVLMRAAGIPARVVTGYFGGTFNRYADYWIVRQSDAHAWDEIWIDGRGWLRVDPTAAIAAARVDPNLRDARFAGDAFSLDLPRHTPWLADLRLRIDALRELWSERIVRYGQGSQQSLLAHLLIPNPNAEKLVSVLAAALALALAWLTWQVRRGLRPRRVDEPARAYARLCAKLAAVGLPRCAHEGAEAYAARVSGQRPDLSDRVGALCRQYSDLRYGGGRADAGTAAFTAAVRAFKPPKFPAS